VSDATRKDALTLVLDDTAYETAVSARFARRKAYVPHDPRQVLCAIPGVVRKVHVKPGERVRRGQPLLVIEAMKMQNDVASPEDAVVKSVPATAGRMVTKGQRLVEFE
jgi:biotin carboxyl carrier protein